MSIVTTPVPTATTTPSTPTRSTLTTGPVWRVTVLSVLVAAVVTELFSIVTRAAGVSMEATSFGADSPSEIPVGGFAMGVVADGLLPGLLLALAFARWARRPARTWVVTTVVLTVLSFIGPLTVEDTATSTKVVLAVSHVVAAAVVIPLVAQRLSQVERPHGPAADRAAEQTAD